MKLLRRMAMGVPEPQQVGGWCVMTRLTVPSSEHRSPFAQYRKHCMLMWMRDSKQMYTRRKSTCSWLPRTRVEGGRGQLERGTECRRVVFAREDPATAGPATAVRESDQMRPRSSFDDGSSLLVCLAKTMKSAFVVLALLVATASAQCDVQSLISTNEGYATCVCTLVLSFLIFNVGKRVFLIMWGEIDSSLSTEMNSCAMLSNCLINQRMILIQP